MLAAPRADLVANTAAYENTPLVKATGAGAAARQSMGTGVFGGMIAATFSAFPNTTFAQNNGVIQLTGVASRYVGLYIGVVLFCLGLFPLIGAVLQQIPKPVLGGATLVMFGSVAAAGVRMPPASPLRQAQVQRQQRGQCGHCANAPGLRCKPGRQSDQ